MCSEQPSGTTEGEGTEGEGRVSRELAPHRLGGGAHGPSIRLEEVTEPLRKHLQLRSSHGTGEEKGRSSPTPKTKKVVLMGFG